MTDDHDACVDEGDVVFDNGECWFYGSVDDGRLVIHDLVALDKSRIGGRSGVGRRACEALRPFFSEIVASGVGEPHQEAGPLPTQRPFLFWRAMLVEGLVDAIIPAFHDRAIDRGNLFEEHSTPFGTFVPGAGLETVATP